MLDALATRFDQGNHRRCGHAGLSAMACLDMFGRSHVPTWCYAAVIQGYHMLSPLPAGVDMILTIASLLHSMDISGFKKFSNSSCFRLKAFLVDFGMASAQTDHKSGRSYGC